MQRQNQQPYLQLGGDSDWWKGAVIYQIYPRSYQDSNGDGIGDLPGIIQRLPYIAALGVDAIWISPFFTSPMKDFGYDVADYCDVDPLFGVLDDFKTLLSSAHQLDVRVLIDLVLSHTSDQHPWFVESRASDTNAKADWYVWADATAGGSPPTNWLSIFGGSAWEWDTRRRQYYLHNFLTSQPDLNFHNRDVQDALLAVVRFWLDLGVDGFRLDTVNMYVHDQQLRDNPPIGDKRVNGIDATNPYALQEPLYNITRPENLAFLERLRGVMDAYPAVTSVGELGAVTDMYARIAEYTETGKRIHMAYSFDFMTNEFSAAHIRRVAENMQAQGGGWACWAFSNHDVMRVVSRWGLEPQAAPLLVAILTSLRGSACLYQGEELGLPEAEIAFEDLQDPFGIRFWPEYKGRDGCRTPMPWRDGANAGFSPEGVKTWLPVPAVHQALAVEVQEIAADSVLQRVSTFLHWRKQQPDLLSGDCQFLDAPEPLLVMLRGQVCCLFNLGSAVQTYVLPVAMVLNPLAANNGLGGRCEGNTVYLGGYGAWFADIDWCQKPDSNQHVVTSERF
ncbi:alpha-amylase family glycosyl hydrolase [Thiothrix fructosivorans]|uniref:Alpha-glucosidase n=1 Tax=Thiothrix fructosivorans TaxID=111770 RepID=A0A8B0SHJ4_9GAMM|nr:alpha-amylase family glycosyl hydrolase [Thiothrix fructosivorans]MBO0613994.1 alpha-glucosidase [Thiothrix fructosivorans]QTX10355.1 alpha-glucosidase [Thiothrix fructosivorans]